MDDRNSKFLQIIIFFIHIGAMVTVLSTPVARGYELSIYSSYPLTLWILLIACLVSDIFLILQGKTKLYRYLPALNIVLIYVFLLYLPYVRGYYLPMDGGWDTLAHMAHSQYIVSAHHVYFSDWYPALHILLATLSLVGVSTIDGASILIISQQFSIFLFSYILIRVVTRSKYTVLLVLFYIPFMFGKWQTILMPSFFVSVFILLWVGLLISIVTSSTYKQYTLLSIIVGASIIFYHPLIATIVCAITLVFILGYFIYPLPSKSHQNSLPSLNPQKLSLLLILWIIFFVVHIYWLLQSVNFTGSFRYLLEGIMTSFNLDGNNILVDEIDVVRTSNASLPLIIDRFVKTYGALTLLSTLGSLWIAIAIKKWFSDDLGANHFYILIQGGLAIITAFILLSGKLVVMEVYRALNYWILLTPLFCGLFFEYASKQTRNRTMVCASIIVVLSLCTALGVFGIYLSPWVGNTNQMVSYQEKYGSEWFIYNFDPEIAVIHGERLRCWRPFLLGVGSDMKINTDSLLPSHFGYLDTDIFGNIYNGSRYLLTDDRLKLGYLAVPDDRQKYISQYLRGDFYRLTNDNSVDKIYSSVGFEIWLVNK